ncbi:MAG TPA: hypothetical protein VM096_06610 [Vicinamibacterales bacterium]|nr:hypothetical protein [Vicinamibacterales bacterium]
MKTAIALVFAFSAASGMSSVAAQAQADGKKYEKGATVTLQGCVVAAEKKGTYVLTNVREWPVATSDMGKFGKRYYWIEKDDKMKGHVGHTIQLVGKITDVDKSEIEFKAGESGNGFNVEIEGPGKDVVTPAANAEVNTQGGSKKKDIPITLLKFKIDDIKMTSSTCAPTM